jgi:hypothetical protein
MGPDHSQTWERPQGGSHSVMWLLGCDPYDRPAIGVQARPTVVLHHEDDVDGAVPKGRCAKPPWLTGRRLEAGLRA